MIRNEFLDSWWLEIQGTTDQTSNWQSAGSWTGVWFLFGPIKGKFQMRLRLSRCKPWSGSHIHQCSDRSRLYDYLQSIVGSCYWYLLHCLALDGRRQGVMLKEVYHCCNKTEIECKAIVETTSQSVSYKISSNINVEFYHCLISL